MSTLYDDFAEIEDDVRARAPKIVYKYRDWSNPFHQAVLKNCSLWFAHPKELNDPYDIRVPVRFDFSEIDNPLFWEKLKFHAMYQFPHLDPDSKEFAKECEDQVKRIKADPKKFFEANHMALRESDLFDRIGVFSLSKNPFNETMWAHYGNNSTGYCIGFDTVELVRSFQVGFGYVTYEVEPPLYSFIRDVDDNQRDQIYLKHKKWEYEEEFRLITFNIQGDKDRMFIFDRSIVKEIFLGAKISDKGKGDIIEILKMNFDSKPALFICKASADAYGFTKEKIDY
jgi:hypothetical protein